MAETQQGANVGADVGVDVGVVGGGAGTEAEDQQQQQQQQQEKEQSRGGSALQPKDSALAEGATEEGDDEGGDTERPEHDVRDEDGEAEPEREEHAEAGEGGDQTEGTAKEGDEENDRGEGDERGESDDDDDEENEQGEAEEEHDDDEEEEEEWLDPFPDLDVDELEQRVFEQQEANETLRLETECLQRYFDRQQADAVETDDEDAQETVQVKERTTRRRSRSMRSSARSAASTAPTVLTDVQKSDIAQRDLDYLRAQLKQFKEESLQKVHTLQAVIAESEVRLMEIPKLEMLFDDEVTRSAELSRSGKVETDALRAFYRRRMKQCETLKDKLNVKNQTMRAHKQRAVSQLKAKDEIGGHLHQVDFEQLKIENEQFSVDIDKRNKELSKLKSAAGRTNQTLEKFKDRLRVLQAESDRVAVEISSREDLIRRIAAERQRVDSAHAKLKARSNSLSQQLEDHRVPEVLDLVKQQATMPKLQQTVRTMERKLDLAQMEFDHTRRSLRSTRRLTATRK